MQPSIYILTNESNKVLYVGVTGNLPKRLWTHCHRLNPESFSARYNLTRLVYYEAHATMESAIHREKQIKGCSRAAKVRLVERANPARRDLSGELLS